MPYVLCYNTWGYYVWTDTHCLNDCNFIPDGAERSHARACGHRTNTGYCLEGCEGTECGPHPGHSPAHGAICRDCPRVRADVSGRAGERNNGRGRAGGGPHGSSAGAVPGMRPGERDYKRAYCLPVLRKPALKDSFRQGIYGRKPGGGCRWR